MMEENLQLARLEESLSNFKDLTIGFGAAVKQNTSENLFSRRESLVFEEEPNFGKQD